ncbi:MAG: DUF6088 family protein [Treponema sp.]|nr:DUF6088 family protein [Treponema sp.]
MEKTAKKRLFNYITRKGKGWVFSAVDFTVDFKRWEIDQSFIALEKEGHIKRLLPGVYYYPKYSNLLKKSIAPDIQQVVKTLARKYEWKVFPEGNTALNYLGLSTQIPAKYIYISSGRSRKYKVGNIDLEFRHRVLAETMISDENTMLVVQAIKSVGQIHADKDFAKKLSKQFSFKEWVKIEKKSHKVTNWILEVIQKAKEFAKNG